MKIDKLFRIMESPQVPTIVRNIVQKAVSKLRVDYGGSIQVDRLELDMVARALGVAPIKAPMATFIRIYDEEDNAVDIETRNYDWIFEPLKQTF